MEKFKLVLKYITIIGGWIIAAAQGIIDAL